MGVNSKIDWCDSTWNPVTGCLHGCDYCYARRIAERFGGAEEYHHSSIGFNSTVITKSDGSIHDLESPYFHELRDMVAPYPFYFDPTFHRYKLDEPQHWKKPRNIFVCSMADLFGNWVPDEWVEEVFKACAAAPQHRYLFLTKNPERYCKLDDANKLPHLDNFWYGSTVTRPGASAWCTIEPNTFLSIEPLLEPIHAGIATFGCAKWVIVGAETGKRKGKVVPQKEWVDEIAAECMRCGKAIFMKDSLRNLMGDDFRQEFPWKAEL